jgi:hypothetical protein
LAAFFVYPLVRDMPGPTGDGWMFRGEEVILSVVICASLWVLIWCAAITVVVVVRYFLKIVALFSGRRAG